MRTRCLFSAACMIAVLCCGSLPEPQFVGPAPAFAAAPGQPAGDAWGTIKGRILLDGAIPAAKEHVVNAQQCLKDGKPPCSDQWVVDAKTKGIRWVVVFLQPAKGKLPIHPALAVPKEKQVVLDQPACMFEPHVLAMRTSQHLLAKNPMTIPHNVVLSGFIINKNQQIAPGREFLFDDLKPEVNRPIIISCGAHGWMKGYLWMFEHPYFAITNDKGEFEIKDAPAGKWNLVIWHDGGGYFGGEDGRDGKPITVTAGQTTDLGEFKYKAP
jgi:hypothetical protein